MTLMPSLLLLKGDACGAGVRYAALVVAGCGRWGAANALGAGGGGDVVLLLMVRLFSSMVARIRT